MKRTFLVVFVTLFALFLANKTIAQTGSGLDTLTQVNGYRLVEYAPGVTFAKTWFTNVNPSHGRFSQFFEVDRINPDFAYYRQYYAIFKRNLPKLIKRTDYINFFVNYAHSNPKIDGHNELTVMDIAVGFHGNISAFQGLLSANSDNWYLSTAHHTASFDSVDCIYLRISGGFKETAIQIDFLTFADSPSGNVVSIIDDFEDSTITDIKNELAIPTTYSLSQNYPNPFNPSTTITFQLSKSNFVSLKVFDVLGREIETLVNEEKSIGEYSVRFDGAHLASGMYLYQINIGHGQFVQTKKMILMK